MECIEIDLTTLQMLLGLTLIKALQPGQLKDGYSYVPHQDAPDAVAYTQSRTPQKGGGFKYGEKRMIYEKGQSS